MDFLHYIFIFLAYFAFVYSHQYTHDLNDIFNMYMKQRKTRFDENNRKFGSSRQHVFRLAPLHYQHQIVRNPLCLPHMWTCGSDLPPCCPGFMCYDGNAKRGRHCVVR